MKKDVATELYWVSHPIIGYVPLDEKGRPHSPTKNDRWARAKKIKLPPRIYKTMDMAAKYSPCKSCAEVRMWSPTLVDWDSVLDTDTD